MYSMHNEGKSVIAERLIRTIKYNIYKYMTSTSKNVYIDNCFMIKLKILPWTYVICKRR